MYFNLPSNSYRHHQIIQFHIIILKVSGNLKYKKITLRIYGWTHLSAGRCGNEMQYMQGRLLGKNRNSNYGKNDFQKVVMEGRGGTCKE